MSGSQDDQAGLRGTLAGFIEANRQSIIENNKVVQDASPDPLARQRDWIGKVIIGLFGGALLLAFAALLLEGYVMHDGAVWKEVAGQSTDLVKSAVLPVVTLVLGYYFGQTTRA